MVNLRPEEQVSSPKRHHLISLQGKPLQVVNLRERNLINKMNTMRNKAMYSTSKLRLSKEFRAMTKNVMGRTTSVEGVDKSIGEESSHSSGHYTRSRRKCYILNIDNTKDEGVHLDTYNSLSPHEIASPAPTVGVSHHSQTVPTNFRGGHEGSKDNSMLSKHRGVLGIQQVARSKLPYPVDEFMTDRNIESSSNERIPISQMPMSARGAKSYSRQEDLDTVYMQSTMQFNREMKANARHGLTSKSPDPNMIIKDNVNNLNLQQSPFVKKDNVSVDNYKKPDVATEPSTFGAKRKSKCNAPVSQSTERRQI